MMAPPGSYILLVLHYSLIVAFPVKINMYFSAGASPVQCLRQGGNVKRCLLIVWGFQTWLLKCHCRFLNDGILFPVSSGLPTDVNSPRLHQLLMNWRGNKQHQDTGSEVWV